MLRKTGHFGGLARARVGDPFEGTGKIGLGLLGVLGDAVGVASRKIAVAAFNLMYFVGALICLAETGRAEPASGPPRGNES